MTWLAAVLFGHLLNAGAFVVDKILLAKTLTHPTVYVFYIGSLGILSFVLLPFGGVSLLSTELALTSAVSGATFMSALLAFFESLKRSEASRVVPFVGAMVPLWTILIAGAMLGERVVGLEWLGVALLIAGAIFISYEPAKGGGGVGLTEAGLIILAGGLFALSFTTAKAVFNGTEFINGFLWTRLFAFLTVVPLLLLPTTRRLVFAGGDDKGEKPHSTEASRGERPTPLFFFGQAMGAAGFVVLNYGIELADRVAIVNALQGVQYAFLFVMLVVLMRLRPGIIKEQFTRAILAQKVFALILLAVGLGLVATG